jgi:hypothetical protein
MPNFSQMTNAELTAWSDNCAKVIEAAPGDYGISPGIIIDFAEQSTKTKTSMTDRVTADDVAAAAFQTEKAERAKLIKLASFLSKTIKVNPDVSDSNKILAGIEPNKPPTYTPPVAPTDLMVNGYENGTNILKWNRAANKPETQFIIEFREAGAAEFVMLDSVTETTYTHTGRTPGVQCAYRIKAKRAGESSAYSNIAVVYMN